MSNPIRADSKIEIRNIVTEDEVRAVEAVQKEVWGCNDLEVVPLNQLVAAREVGGILVGAFDGEKMAGFVFGFVGYERPRASPHVEDSTDVTRPFILGRDAAVHPVIHSHMLAVRPEYRSLELGYRLKLAQRERALAAGFNAITWTYDPLQCRNAHLNFGKLGVVSDAYKINFYGAKTSSFLHGNGTDRLWVTWLLSSPRVATRLNEGSSPRPAGPDLTTLISVGKGQIPVRNAAAASADGRPLAIEIPGDISEIGSRAPELSVAWREAAREAFTEALALGYLVSDFHRAKRDDAWLGFYSLTCGIALDAIP